MRDKTNAQNFIHGLFVMRGHWLDFAWHASQELLLGTVIFAKLYKYAHDLFWDHSSLFACRACFHC